MSHNPEATEKDATSAQIVLLIVEDDEDIGEFLTHAIKEETSYHTFHVTDAVQALEAVRSIKPSLFLLDYHLPGIDGLELADRLHATEGLETVPTLMMSANAPPKEALRQRHITFLKKPFDLNDLLIHIERLLEKRSE
jgi:DNA-binding response OmpR family regulator